MRLTRYSDYAMRVLLYLGRQPDRLCSIAEIARAYGISQNHLMKVINDLVNAGWLASVRGRGGGVRLARPADEISVGAIIRHTEDGFDLVGCGDCIISPACGLTSVLDEALAAFLAVLDGYTLADVLARRGDFLPLLRPLEPRVAAKDKP
ncbi:transcriptional regulator, BadM/Rrf2 family [Paracoccus aminovorans]|uniref:Transcriptional regulator, BadM/Rrf2 family n=1 Tax=Paracoccus aminovorans TaxID=34004 RepID=A0A1I3CX81_9RHOB|nr:Rrf2 family transcriptional regulator [Paracoccus aminovorans]CQR83941.1 BadM/Rrf2 family transcriptional regulator [Paracoccus aminovorans]SFH79085.1 transcriptional regulator, BadM/Rrf2 family [Paracoccus aminovorans]